MSFSPVFKSARPVSEQVPFKVETNVEMARNDLPVTHDTFRWFKCF